MLIHVVLSLILFTLVNLEQFYAQRQPVKNTKKTFRGRKLTLRADCRTPSKLTVIFTQDDYMLLFDPQRSQCTDLEVYSWAGNHFQKRACELANGEHWFYFRHFEPGKANIFKMFDARTQEEILPETVRLFLPKKPPKVRSAHTKIGFGEVWTYVGHPQESQPNLLGYRISLLDLEKFSDWKVVGEFQNVEYKCSFPELKPVHNCPQSQTEGVYCTLFSDLVWWTDSYVPTSNQTMKFVKIETFRIPTEGCDRQYSDPLVLPLYNLTDEMLLAGNASIAAASERNFTDWLWAIFLGLALLLLAVCIPLLFLCAEYKGVGAAQKLWNNLAGAPGNVTVALGANQIVWENCPPWRCDN